MERINLLDCTLRDGGYINDWHFGKESISNVIENMLATNIEVLEIGFLKNEPYNQDRCVFNSMEQVKKIIASHKKAKALYSVMAEVVNPIPLEKIEEHDNASADIIRVVIWKTKCINGKFVDALDEGYEYCQGIVNKGYKLCIQPARVDQYSDEEFSQMVQKFSQLNPLAIYVVDSWGTQNAEELLHYMHIADEAMPKDVMLGYHGHNNMLQALSVSQAMLKENFARKIMIDASVYGIGRGAGNLNIEIIAKYLNEHYGKCYNILPMLNVYETCVKKIYEKEPWGYSVPYYLTAKYNCNPAYARLFKNVSVKNFESALKRLSGEQRVIFNANNLDFSSKKKD